MILCGKTTAVMGESSGAGAGTPPPPGGKWAEGGKGWNGLRRVAYVKINNGS